MARTAHFTFVSPFRLTTVVLVTYTKSTGTTASRFDAGRLYECRDASSRRRYCSEMAYTAPRVSSCSSGSALSLSAAYIAFYYCFAVSDVPNSSPRVTFGKLEHVWANLTHSAHIFVPVNHLKRIIHNVRDTYSYGNKFTIRLPTTKLPKRPYKCGESSPKASRRAVTVAVFVLDAGDPANVNTSTSQQ